MILDKILKSCRLIMDFFHIYRPTIRFLNNVKIRRLSAHRRVTFVVYQSSVWKSSGIYGNLKNTAGVDVSITVMPILENGNLLLNEFHRTTEYFQTRGFNMNLIPPEIELSKSIEHFADIDTVVFSDCWNLPQSNLYYYLLLFKDCVYIPYSHQVSKYGNYQAQYNQPFHNLVRAIYAPHKYEFDIFRGHSDVGNDNVKFFGYPGVSRFIEAIDKGDRAAEIFPNDPWLLFENKLAKRVVWAPHHSINWIERRYSNFLEMHEQMLSLADLYQNEINFVFKPHPMLRQVLYSSSWGIDKTDNYYKSWQERVNCNVEEGAYEALLFYSDALIHDSGSFIAEYSYLNKPHAFVLSSDDIIGAFNEFGQKCLRNTSQIRTEGEVTLFLNDVIKVKKFEDNELISDFVSEIRNISRGCPAHIASDILLRSNSYK